MQPRTAGTPPELSSMLAAGPAAAPCRHVQREACELLHGVLGKALHAGDLAPLRGVLQPTMSTLVQCFSQEAEATAAQAAPAPGQPGAAEPSPPLQGLVSIINLLVLQVRRSRAAAAGPARASWSGSVDA